MASPPPPVPILLSPSQMVADPVYQVTNLRTKSHDMVFGDHWSTSIKHKTDVILEQIDVGLYAMKRYAFYLQKVTDVKKPALQELKKVTDYEGKEKSSKAGKDAMSQYIVTYSMTQTINTSLIEAELYFLNKIETDVVQGITNWLKAAEKKLKTLTDRLNTAFSKQKDLLIRISKSRADCHKQWATLQSSWKESEKCDQQKLSKKNGAKEYELAFKKYVTQAQKTYQIFNSFETEVKEGNEQQSYYWDEDLPQCVKELEQLETDRLQNWGLSMESFRNAQNEFYTRALETSRILDETTMSLDGAADIKNWSDLLVKAYGLPREPDVILDYLPCEYTRIQQGDDLQQLLSVDLSVALKQRQAQQEKQLQFSNRNNPNIYGQNGVNQSATVHMAKPQYSHAIGKVLFDYPQHDADDLAMLSGEFIAILDMPLPLAGEDSTWWVGAKFDQQTGRLLNKGIFPSNYVAIE